MATDERLIKVTRAVANRRRDFIMVLEDIYDPHNAEAIFRSCEAFGVPMIYLISVKQARFNPKGVGKSSSSSANKWLDFEWFDSTEACFERLKKDGFTIVGTVLSDKAELLQDASYVNAEKVALVMGNESKGLSQNAIDGADRHLMIDMKGMTQSLNLSVSAAVCMQEITRQRAAVGLWQYSDDEQATMVDDFLGRKKISQGVTEKSFEKLMSFEEL